MRLAGPGSPDTPGVSILGDGIDVAIHAPDAEAVAVCLFDAADLETARIRLPARTGPIHHGHIAGVPEGTRYGLRAYGPWDPASGHRFNPAKLLLDPWAIAIDRPFRLDPLLFDGDGPRHDDTARLMPKAIVTATPPASAGKRTAFDWDRQVIYELHVRGFSMTNPDIPAGIRGTYAALGHPASLRHLTRLGITTVELMPSAAWVDERHLPPLHRSNYWGYNPIAFLAPDPRLAPGGWPEVRAAVDALHDAGLSVILDVVLNHSGESDELGPTLSMRGLDNAGYYRLTADRSRYANDAGCGNILAMDRPHVLRLGMDALRAWAIHGGLDGFRLDLATTLGRRDSGFDPDAPFLAAVEQDPVLSRCVMIAEPWDIGAGGYQLGAFPPRWGEWNDRYRDTVRRFWRGDASMVGALATRFAGSADVFAPSTARQRPLSRSINYVIAHDGFTLADLVAYEQKHNQANGEDNRDGTDDNLSWNNGAEGPSSDPQIAAARSSDARALLATLLLSRGTPMLSMGDELGRTQHGNNNAYAQDNAGSWIDWASADHALIETTAALISLRRSLGPLFDGRELTGQPADGDVIQDVTWHAPDGAAMTVPDWNNAASRTLIAVPYAAGLRTALVFHADHTPIEIMLPAARPGYFWRGVTNGPAVDQHLTINPRSVTVFQEKAERSSDPLADLPPNATPQPAQPHLGGAANSSLSVHDTQGYIGAPKNPTASKTQGVASSLDAGEPSSAAQGRIRGTGQSVEIALHRPASGKTTDAQLDRIAAMAGIDPIWWDVGGGYHRVPVDTKRALLAAMRLPAATPDDLNDSLARLALLSPLPPVLTARQGQAIPVRLGQSRPAWITLLREDHSVERFHTQDKDLVLPPQPIGRHRILNEDRPERPCHLTVAPDTCYLPAELLDGERRFGVSAHLYAMRSAGDQGIGDFTTLTRLATAAVKAGASMIGLNPLHALFPHDRDRASPYQPSDRRFLDPIYIDVSRFPGGDDIPSPPGPVDYAAVWQAKRAVLRAALRPGNSRPIPPALLRFATFEAIAEIRGSSDWKKWPTALRHPDARAVAAFAAQHRETIEFHAFMQCLADQQLATAAASASETGLSLGLYRDLAVGAAPDGAEAWSAQDTLMRGASIGAPPDPFAAQGQNWSLPPPDPIAMRRDGYSGFQQLLVANMRHAGALRIDHVMGLRRLFVIPEGAEGKDGAYVTYPLPDLLAQVALESHRARCLVVGEDLGTVPEGMSEALAAANILSYSVLWFVRRDGLIRPAAEWPRLAAACVSTHDLATLAGWWNGTDIAEKRALSLLDDAQAEQIRDDEKTALIQLLRSEGWLAQAVDPRQKMPVAFAAAVHAFVAATPALLALVQADDLAGERIGVNLPGTDRERPNWRRRLTPDVADLFRTPLARAILDALRSRAGAVSRARLIQPTSDRTLSG
ncbi:glycogen debranching protein GlgX [Rhodopila sp.]|uniref:glycogen debranching protein GlgX n=1 Tax=Rhodopila sp. TaxID=2480087 RepID=UPI003D108629